MIPIRSNLNKETCSPISSNCVIWQGPDIACINLCTGDTVSEVVNKLALELCEIKDQLNFTDLDLKCLVDLCITCPEPEKTLGIILELIINKVCDLQELIDKLSGTAQDEILVRIATCFYPDYTDSNGDITKDVPISSYVQKIAQKVCKLITDLAALDIRVTSTENDVINLDGRVTILENQGQIQVTPVCSSTPTAKDIDVAFDGLESSFCQLRTATGLPGDILDVLDKECQPVAPATTVTSLLNGNTLWISETSQNLADTLTKMWLAICDLRAAVSLIQDTCCQVNCDDLIVDFDVILDYNSQTDVYSLVFFFGEKTNLPLAFGDCNTTLGTKFTIKDEEGHTATIYLKIREDILNDTDALTNGYYLPLPTNINPASTITLSSDLCITNGELNCIKCISKEILYTAPPCDYCEITATGGDVTIIYQVCE